MSRQEMRFLYRSDQGRIDRPTWWRAQAPLALALLALTLVWRAVEPYAHRSLADTPLIDAAAIAAYSYLIVYAFAALLLLVASYYVSAKRFRDRGMPAGLAGVLPLAALLYGALSWTQRQDGGMFPLWIVWAGLAALACAALWTVYELGAAAPRAAR
jgi:uncharacterized membrane protein YhaH (DUF805 family)